MMRRGGKHQSGTVGCCLLGCFAFDEASGRCVGSWVHDSCLVMFFWSEWAMLLWLGLVFLATVYMTITCFNAYCSPYLNGQTSYEYMIGKTHKQFMHYFLGNGISILTFDISVPLVQKWQKVKKNIIIFFVISTVMV